MLEQIPSELESIEGWLYPSAAKLTTSLIRRHLMPSTQLINVVELGVFRGKYLALLYWATRGSDSIVVGYEGMFDGPKKVLEPPHVASAMNKIRANVELISGESSRLRIRHADTMTLTTDEIRKEFDGQVGFISVDAGHEAVNVVNDMALALSVLGPEGVIAADDAFNPNTPGVPEGIFEFMGTQGRGQLAPFAYCANKLFFTRVSNHENCFDWAIQYLLTCEDEYVVNSRQFRNSNAAIGFFPYLFGYPLVTFTL
jgi:Methyltransferase domain